MSRLCARVLTAERLPDEGAALRVTGGTARGVPLGSPRAPGVRPTTDRVRSALFNILARYGLEDSHVADLFAGTGSLGIEALSRGAARSSFVEADRRQIAVIKANLQVTGFAERADVHMARAEDALGRLESCDFLLMDPPYTQPFPAGLIARIGDAGLLRDEGILVCGHATRTAADDRCGAMAKWDDRRYGDASLAFYSLAEAAA